MFPPTRDHLQVIQIVQECKLNLSFAYTRMYVILMEAIRVVLLTEYSTLTPSNTAYAYFNSSLYVRYMFRPFLRPSLGVSIQKSSKIRYNEIKCKGLPVYNNRFLIILNID